MFGIAVTTIQQSRSMYGDTSFFHPDDVQLGNKGIKLGNPFLVSGSDVPKL
jgi:hypothetical protein